jgi:hypothetical protein
LKKKSYPQYLLSLLHSSQHMATDTDFDVGISTMTKDEIIAMHFALEDGKRESAATKRGMREECELDAIRPYDWLQVTQYWLFFYVVSAAYRKAGTIVASLTSRYRDSSTQIEKLTADQKSIQRKLSSKPKDAGTLKRTLAAIRQSLHDLRALCSAVEPIIARGDTLPLLCISYADFRNLCRAFSRHSPDYATIALRLCIYDADIVFGCMELQSKVAVAFFLKTMIAHLCTAFPEYRKMLTIDTIAADGIKSAISSQFDQVLSKYLVRTLYDVIQRYSSALDQDRAMRIRYSKYLIAEYRIYNHVGATATGGDFAWPTTCVLCHITNMMAAKAQPDDIEYDEFGYREQKDQCPLESHLAHRPVSCGEVMKESID